MPNSNEEEIDKKVIDIVKSDIKGMNIKHYIFDILPKKIIKNTLNLYEDEEDDDKSLTLVNLMEFVNKLLETNMVVSITKEDKIIKTLSEYVYPYFKDYIDINLKMMKKLTDAYLSMILSLNTKLDLYSVVLEKALIEKI